MDTILIKVVLPSPRHRNHAKELSTWRKQSGCDSSQHCEIGFADRIFWCQIWLTFNIQQFNSAWHHNTANCHQRAWGHKSTKHWTQQPGWNQHRSNQQNIWEWWRQSAPTGQRHRWRLRRRTGCFIQETQKEAEASGCSQIFKFFFWEWTTFSPFKEKKKTKAFSSNQRFGTSWLLKETIGW